MNILFIHGNFPGQFKDIAPHLHQFAGGRSFFLTLSDNSQGISIPGVEFIQFKLHRDVNPDTHPYIKSSEVAILKGQAVVRALLQLNKDFQFIPDVVICHGGMGFGLFIKAVFPHVKLISYMEWFFTAANSLSLFEDMSINDRLRVETRNLPLLQEMVQADEIVCPTEWQRSQFPSFIRERIKVIFDGVDTEYFCPGPIPDPLILKDTISPLVFGPEKLLLTYGTRGMEPLRGFPEFMRAAAVAQQQFDNLEVVVFGNDRSPYSYASPHSSGSWKQYLLDELSDSLDISRLHFTGLINYGELIQLFRRSDAHCYFTRPYVVSWGIFQAAACGAKLLVNKFSGIDEVFYDSENMTVCDLDNQDDINKRVIEQLSFCDIRKRKKGVSSLKDGLSLREAVANWIQVIG